MLQKTHSVTRRNVGRKPPWRIDRPEWEELILAEPRLDDLFRAAKHYRVPTAGVFCAEILWHARFKPQLTFLVGFRCRSEDPVMRTMQAYDVAFAKIYEALPACRGCACLAD
jgi:hypothetical protein